jgi:hypothetical protein
MPLTNEKQIRDLCRQAMNETNTHKLLNIFLELDRAARWAEQPGACCEDMGELKKLDPQRQRQQETTTRFPNIL